jgi:hypothetical protein
MQINPEMQILLGLLRAEPAIGVTPEQWQEVVRLSEQHRVAALLYWRLKELEISAQVPPDLFQELHSASLETAARNLRIYTELSGLFEKFQQVSLEAILLKGAYLAEEVYGDIALRPMDDVDLLVRESDLERFEEIMRAMDFTWFGQSTQLNQEFHHFIFTHARNGLCVEVHWDLIDATKNIRVDLEGLWERARATRVAGLPVRALTPEDLLLHLCIHASVHVFNYGLSGLYDLTESLRHFQGKIDWECLRQRAYAWNAARCAYINMRLARELLKAPVPEDWLKTLQPADFPPEYQTMAQELLLANGQVTDVKIPSWPRLAKFWKAGNLAQKVGLAWKRLFLSRQNMALIYHVPPGSLRIWLYYPVRIWDLLKENSRQGWQLLRGDQHTLSQADQQDQVNAMVSWLLEGDYL